MPRPSYRPRLTPPELPRAAVCAAVLPPPLSVPPYCRRCRRSAAAAAAAAIAFSYIRPTRVPRALVCPIYDLGPSLCPPYADLLRRSTLGYGLTLIHFFCPYFVSRSDGIVSLTLSLISISRAHDAHTPPAARRPGSRAGAPPRPGPGRGERRVRPLCVLRLRRGLCGRWGARGVAFGTRLAC